MWDSLAQTHETLVLTLKIVDWVDLAIIDLEKFDAQGGKEKLAAQLYDAIKNIGNSITPYRTRTRLTTSRCRRIYLCHQFWSHARRNRWAIRYRKRPLWSRRKRKAQVPSRPRQRRVHWVQTFWSQRCQTRRSWEHWSLQYSEIWSRIRETSSGSSQSQMGQDREV